MSCKVYTPYRILLLSTSKYIFFVLVLHIILPLTVLLLCVVSIYTTQQCAVPCCIFHTTAPCQLENLLELSRATHMYSKLDSKNRVSELDKQSVLPGTSALRTVQFCFPRPLLYSVRT